MTMLLRSLLLLPLPLLLGGCLVSAAKTIITAADQGRRNHLRHRH
jgi:hypothetical protein